MTRKHFQLLADNLARVKPSDDGTDAEYHAWDAAVVAVADACQAANAQFDRARFYKAANR